MVLDTKEKNFVRSTSTAAASSVPDSGRWQAKLDLIFAGGDGTSRLKKSRHCGPLYIQKPFYPEGSHCAHVVLLHPPGGVVSGDDLWTQVSADRNASVLLTMPGATRLYHARSEKKNVPPLKQHVRNILKMSNGGCIEWLPGETIIFNGAHVSLNTHVKLDSSSMFFGWEIVCLGLPESDSPFVSGSVSQTFSIDLDEQPRIRERIAFDAKALTLNSHSGFQGKPVSGFGIAGPFFNDVETIKERLREHMEAHVDAQAFSVTDVRQFIVVRYLGSCSDAARRCFIRTWQQLRPALIQREACLPRIWAT